jgi:phosphoglycolate phosphatase-like HAD superfamily hydrolase
LGYSPTEARSTAQMARRPVCIYIDVDDTLIRSAGARRIPIPALVGLVQDLANRGAALYCWSSGGADYAQSVAEELGIADCFRAFLPKPDIVVDDQPLPAWSRLLHVLPANLTLETLDSYWTTVWGLEE